MDSRSMSRVYVNQYPSKRSYKPNDLLFEDNFDKLDTKVWSYDEFMYSNSIGDNSEEFTMFTDNKDNLAVKDGKLLITPIISQRNSKGSYKIPGCKRATCYEGIAEMCSYRWQSNKPYSYPSPVDSARITTVNSFSFAYGRIEISARLPQGDWLIPYIMLEPDNLNCTLRKQLRIAYAKAKDFDRSFIWGGPVVIYTVVNPANGMEIFERTSHMTFSRDTQPNQFHNFTLIWTPTQIVLYVDKRKYGCFSNGHQYDESYHIVLGVSAGGHLEFEDSPYKPWQNVYSNASRYFHDSFKGCCGNGSGDCTDMDGLKKKRKCSRPWGEQKTMAIEYVRVYAV